MPRPLILGVIGHRKSGKTTLIEILTRKLIQRGISVCVIKHIPYPSDFTIDTPGKDTYRYAKAGSKQIIAIAPREVVTIKKVDTSKFQLDDILNIVGKGHDVIILEGFKSIIEKLEDVQKIVAVKNLEEARDFIKSSRGILFLTGPMPKEIQITGLPCVDVANEADKMVNMIMEKLNK